MLAAFLVLPRAAAAMVAGGALPQTLSVQRPIIVHVWDAKPDKLETFAIDEVSKACRNAGAAAVLCSPKLLKAFAEEQELAIGSFPEPLPIIAQVALKDMIETETASAEIAAGAKKLGAAAIGFGYYASDWPEAEALEEALKGATAAAEEVGLDSLLLAQFGAGGVEGSDSAAEVAARVGATAALAKEGGAEGTEGGATLLGSWDGTDEELQRLREAGFAGMILKNACRGDVGRGARTSSPSIAAMGVTKQVKTALSKAGTSVWGGAGGVTQAKTASMGDYFERGGMNR